MDRWEKLHALIVILCALAGAAALVWLVTSPGEPALLILMGVVVGGILGWWSQ